MHKSNPAPELATHGTSVQPHTRTVHWITCRDTRRQYCAHVLKSALISGGAVSQQRMARMDAVEQVMMTVAA